jgi:hypothetical protein
VGANDTATALALRAQPGLGAPRPSRAATVREDAILRAVRCREYGALRSDDLFIFVRDELLIRVVADSNHARVKAKGSSPGYSTSRPFLDLRRGLERIARRFLLGEQNLEVPVDIGVGRCRSCIRNAR